MACCFSQRCRSQAVVKRSNCKTAERIGGDCALTETHRDLRGSCWTEARLSIPYPEAELDERLSVLRHMTGQKCNRAIGTASRPGCLPSGITSVRRPRAMPDGQPRAGQVSTSANAKALKLVVEGA